MVRKAGQMALVTLLLLSVSNVWANDPKESKAVEKAKKAVEKAASYDWKTLAESAEVCILRKENLEEAKTWLEKSIEINEDPLNLELMGDLHALEGNKSKAMDYYGKAITKGKEQNFWFNTDNLQKKIWELR